MNAKHILIVLAIAFFLCSAFKKADVVQNIEFQGETYELSDTFKLYGYAEIRSEEQARNPSSITAKSAIADEFERTISRLPPPPRSTQTWF